MKNFSSREKYIPPCADPPWNQRLTAHPMNIPPLLQRLLLPLRTTTTTFFFFSLRRNRLFPSSARLPLWIMHRPRRFSRVCIYIYIYIYIYDAAFEWQCGWRRDEHERKLDARCVVRMRGWGSESDSELPWEIGRKSILYWRSVGDACAGVRIYSGLLFLFAGGEQWMSLWGSKGFR